MAEFVREVERLGGAVEVAHPQSHIADGAIREPDAIHEPVALKLVAGLTRLLLGLGPLPVKHLQLRAVDTTDARIPTGTLAAHPALALIGPLGGALEVADAAAGRDGAAEDVARGAEVEASRRSRRSRLVHLGEALLPSPGHHVGHALQAHGDIERLRVVPLSADLDRLVKEPDARFKVALPDCSDTLEQGDEGMES